jgi:sirohydrochlorin ferrochelatase/(2Fe-2S) ferredoxin
MNRTALLMVGHGSRQPQANHDFEELVAEYRRHRPELAVAHGYIELADPPLAVALSRIATTAERVVVFPLLLFAAGHVKNDVPLALAAARRAHPEVEFIAARPLGVHPALVELALQRARQAEGAGAGQEEKQTVVVVGRGSSDPDANADFFKLVRLFEESAPFVRVLPCFIGVTRPTFEQTLEWAARGRPERLLVVPYMLFAGRLVGQLQERLAGFAARYPWIKTALAPPLGIDPKLLAVVDERIREALGGQAPLPCDTCQYRVPLAGIQEQVGGLRALLWSVRHSFTHTQAIPHVHAHRPVRKHVFVCVNRDCAERGSVALVAALRARVKERGHDRDIKVTKTACMGRCGEGPTVAVYPDGVWYRTVQAADAAELFEEHLLHDRLVARLVDNILQ